VPLLDGSVSKLIKVEVLSLASTCEGAPFVAATASCVVTPWPPWGCAVMRGHAAEMEAACATSCVVPPWQPWGLRRDAWPFSAVLRFADADANEQPRAGPDLVQFRL
jgi:hypothetical protein